MQMVTNSLRILIDTHLKALKSACGIKEIGYRRASDQKAFPHVVWNISSVSPMDMGREDYIVDFDVWTRSEAEAFDIMDAIKRDLEFLNEPSWGILPTFYNTSMGTIDDPDKTLVHGVVRTECQVYQSGITDAGILGKELTNGDYN